MAFMIYISSINSPLHNRYLMSIFKLCKLKVNLSKAYSSRHNVKVIVNVLPNAKVPIETAILYVPLSETVSNKRKIITV